MKKKIFTKRIVLAIAILLLFLAGVLLLNQWQINHPVSRGDDTVYTSKQDCEEGNDKPCIPLCEAIDEVCTDKETSWVTDESK